MVYPGMPLYARGSPGSCAPVRARPACPVTKSTRFPEIEKEVLIAWQCNVAEVCSNIKKPATRIASSGIYLIEAKKL
jgi:hypothetical protein